MSMHSSPAPVISAELARDLAATAAGFLASLNARQCDRAVLSFASDDQRDWHYVPRQRPGLPLRDMDEAQRAAALALMRTGLSEAGGRKAIAIMDRENILKRSDPSETYDPLDYAFAVYGDPRMPPPWGWSVEGHHLSLHFTVRTSTEIAVTPFFMAVAPLVPHAGEGSDDPVLLSERDLAAQVVRTLDAQERQQAIISDRSMGDILSGPGREDSLRTPVGLPLGSVTEARRDALLVLVDEYLGRLRAELAQVERARLREAGVKTCTLLRPGPSIPASRTITGFTGRARCSNTITPRRTPITSTRSGMIRAWALGVTRSGTTTIGTTRSGKMAAPSFFLVPYTFLPISGSNRKFLP